MPRNFGSRIIFDDLPGVALTTIPLAAEALVGAAASVGAAAAAVGAAAASVGAAAAVGAAAGAAAVGAGAGAAVGAAAGVPPHATKISVAITSKHASFKNLLIQSSFRVRGRNSDSCRRRRF